MAKQAYIIRYTIAKGDWRSDCNVTVIGKTAAHEAIREISTWQSGRGRTITNMTIEPIRDKED